MSYCFSDIRGHLTTTTSRCQPFPRVNEINERLKKVWRIDVVDVDVRGNILHVPHNLSSHLPLWGLTIMTPHQGVEPDHSSLRPFMPCCLLLMLVSSLIKVRHSMTSMFLNCITICFSLFLRYSGQSFAVTKEVQLQHRCCRLLNRVYKVDYGNFYLLGKP